MRPTDPNPFTGQSDNPNYFSAWATRLELLNTIQKIEFHDWVDDCIKKVPYKRWPGIENDHAISQDEILGMVDAFPELAHQILFDLAHNNYFGRLDRHPWFIPYLRAVDGQMLTIYEIVQWSLHVLATAFFPGKDDQGRDNTSGTLLCWMQSFRAPWYMWPIFFIFRKRRPLKKLFSIYFANIPAFISAVAMINPLDQAVRSIIKE